jgi:hypothetical protein
MVGVKTGTTSETNIFFYGRAKSPSRSYPMIRPTHLSYFSFRGETDTTLRRMYGGCPSHDLPHSSALHGSHHLRL